MKISFTTRPAWLSGKLPIAKSADSTFIREGDGRQHLNTEQQAALETLEGRHIINAGAGTGKSTVLIARMLRIRQAYPDSHILMVSFTKKSALNLRNRIGAVRNVSVSTFHSLSYHILSSSGWQFTVSTNEAAATALIQRLIGRKQILIEEVKRSLHDANHAEKAVLFIRQKYLNSLKKRHIVTFDTMQIFALELLEKNPVILKNWQEKYDFWEVDEYQDVDPNQQKLVELLSGQGNLTVVGDMRQAIYSFRGSVPHVMEDFAQNAEMYSMTTNYRCNPAILGLANRILPKYTPLLAAKTEAHPTYPNYLMAENEADEAKQVVAEILRLHKQGQAFSDMSVLFRSSTASSALIEELLTKKIPVISKANASLKETHMPYAGIIKLFHFMLNPNDKAAFRAIMPILYLKKALLPTICKQAAATNCSLLHASMSLPLPFFHKDYLRELAKAIAAAVSMTPKQAVLHLFKHGYGKYVGTAYESALTEFADELENYPSIPAYLALLEEMQTRMTAMKKLVATHTDCLQLMTIHAAKGKEWHTVFLIGAYDGCLPSSRDDANLDEERRLLYVAITRAKERLYISYPRTTANSIEPKEASRFLREAFSNAQN